jgi:CheY-like chemotaxis protein
MPVIMMSGHATIETAVEATKIGAQSFLEKPITMQKLLKAVEAGLARNCRRRGRASRCASPAWPRPAAGAGADGGSRDDRRPDLPPVVEMGPQARQLFELDKPLRDARDEFEKCYFEFHLAKEGGSMTRVAEKTGLERTHLYRKLKQLGVDLSRGKRGGCAAHRPSDIISAHGPVAQLVEQRIENPRVGGSIPPQATRSRRLRTFESGGVFHERQSLEGTRMDRSEVKFKQGASDGKVFDVLCVECKRPTKHAVMASLNKDGQAWNKTEEWSVEWTDYYQIVKCQGCETVTFRHTSWFSEDPHDEQSPEHLYPKRDANTVAAKPFTNVPTPLRRLYTEIVDAHNADSVTLCAGGLRALVEGICADRAIADGPVSVATSGGGTQVIRSSSLAGKIAGLHEKGLLTKHGADILHQLRFLGNEALHELAKPSPEELRLALNIIEHVLEQLYEIPEKGLELQRTRARRLPVSSAMAGAALGVSSGGTLAAAAQTAQTSPQPGPSALPAASGAPPCSP